MSQLHVVCLPYPDPQHSFSKCAYSSKIERFGRMMTPLGYKVIVYGGEHTQVPEAELVVVLTDIERDKYFGEWRGKTLQHWSSQDVGWREMNKMAIQEIGKRIQTRDIICLIGGNCQAAIKDVFCPKYLVVEWGVGYEGVCARFRCFESHAWLHTIAGNRGAMKADGNSYDTVIHNSFDVDDFPEGKGDGGYVLYIGRLIARKGLYVVRDIALRISLPLVVAGEGDLDLVPPGAVYVGVVGPEKRARLMGGAVCCLVPTSYIGPFEGVAAEAQLTGTPVLTTPWGAFAETVEDGKTGFRCHTLQEYLDAVEKAKSLDRSYIRQRAIAMFSMHEAAKKYDTWFKRLQGLHGKGWYDGVPDARNKCSRMRKKKVKELMKK